MSKRKIDSEKLGITYEGGGYYPKNPPRIESKHGLEEVEICKKWLLKYCKPRRNCHWLDSSYALKHVVERWAGRYVSNGTFIQACIDLEYIPYAWGDSWLNLYFNISVDPKDLKRE